MNKKNRYVYIFLGFVFLLIGWLFLKNYIELVVLFSLLGIGLISFGVAFICGVEAYSGQNIFNDRLKQTHDELAGVLRKGSLVNLDAGFACVANFGVPNFQYGVTLLPNTFDTKRLDYADRSFWISVDARSRAYFFIHKKISPTPYWHAEADFYIGIPIQSGEYSFDQEYRVVALKPGVSKKGLSNPRFRQKIQNLFDLGFDNLCIRPWALKANMVLFDRLPNHCNADILKKGIDLMKEMSEILPSL